MDENTKEKKGKKERECREKTSKIKTLWRLWKGDTVVYDDNGNSRIMQDFTAWVFAFFAWIFFIGTILVLVGTIYASVNFLNWSKETLFGYIVGLFLIASLLVFCLAIAFILKVMSHDIKREKDRHYVLALFSGMIGFVAMIISLIALFK